MATPRRPWYTILYVQVLLAIAVGILIGHYFPNTGVALKPLGDGFISLIKMMIGPVTFCTVVHGIGSMRDLKKIGRVRQDARLFRSRIDAGARHWASRRGSSAAGQGIRYRPRDARSQRGGWLCPPCQGGGHGRPPAGDHPGDLHRRLCQGRSPADPAGLDSNRFRHFTSGRPGRADQRSNRCHGEVFFSMIGIIVRAAPIGALGAMAFTVGAYGVVSLVNLVELIATFYLTSLLFVLVVLGTIARLAGFSILRFLAYIKDELLIVLGTSSSETVLPHIIQKMQRLGASKSVVGLVIPTGYSFNLDGTNIYMTLATLFLAQATNTPLGLGQELGILAIAMITSKGASGVTGAGFVTLAATLAIVPDIPIQSLAILLGIDKFMSECRALTNLVGNGVACVVISRWEGELDADKLHETMAHPIRVGEEMEESPV